MIAYDSVLGAVAGNRVGVGIQRRGIQGEKRPEWKIMTRRSRRIVFI